MQLKQLLVQNMWLKILFIDHTLVCLAGTFIAIKSSTSVQYTCYFIHTRVGADVAHSTPRWHAHTVRE